MGNEIQEKRFNWYQYEPIKKPLLDTFRAKYLVEKIEKGHSEILVDFTLGKYGEKHVYVKNNEIIINLDNRTITLEIEKLYKIAEKENKIFSIEDTGDLLPIEIRGRHYYKLWTPSIDSAPTISIDGINMHRVKNIDPFSDARIKILSLKIKPKKALLDICTGLGYTAIWAHRFGASVITVEKDENVLNIARYNPWSEELVNIPIILSDILDIIGELPNNYFDYIIHDPPRFSLAGELYSYNFYKELYRVLRKGGKMFHYTGSPGEKYRGKKFIKGIGERLTKAKFATRFIPRAQGFIAIKKF